MPAPPHDTITYTTAPADYDWFGTRTVRIAGRDKRGKTIRMVRSDPKHLQSQRDRYMSGLHMAVDETEWEKLVRYGLVTEGSELALNPMGSSSGGMVLAVGALLAGIVWLWTRPSKAASVSASPAPVTVPPLATGPLPPPPAPIPPPPVVDCQGKIIQQYKFANQAPSIQVFRRLYIWDTAANANYTKLSDQGFAPASTQDLLKTNLNTGVVMPSGFVESMGLELVTKLENARSVPPSSPQRYLAEVWLKTSDGWCLSTFATNYEPWVL
jgi:hypothetical protein